MDNVERLLRSARPGTTVTDAHLDALREIESSNNPRAVNKDSGAMGAYQFMPSTVTQLAKQGIKFDPFNEPQAREAARQHLQDFVDKSGGDLNKGLALYGGHVTKDPSNYINKFNAALARQSKARGASPEVDQGGEPEDNVIRLLQSAKTVTPEQPKPAPPKLSELSPFGSPGVVEGDLVRKIMRDRLGPKPAQTAPAATADQIPTTTVAPQPAAPKTEYKVGSMADLGKGIVSMADVAAGNLTGLVGQGSYAIQRAMGVPEPEARKSVAEFVEKRTDPFGRALGIAEDPAYKAEATRRLTNFISENVGKGTAWISEKTGIPLGDVENMVGSLGLLPIPGIAKAGQKAGAATYGAEQALRDQFAAKPAAPRVEPGIGPKPPALTPTAEADLRAGFEARQAQRRGEREAATAKEQAFQDLANAPSLREAQARGTLGAGLAQPIGGAGAMATPGSVGAAAVETPRARAEKAANLPVPITIDRAQATRNPTDVKFAGVAAKTPHLAEQVFEHYADQNAKVQQNMQAGIEATGTQSQGISPTDFGQRVKTYVQGIKDARMADIRNQYAAAEAAGELAQPVSYQPVLDLIAKETGGRPTVASLNPLYKILEEEFAVNDPTGSRTIGVRQLEDVRQLINDQTDWTDKRQKALSTKVKRLIDGITENAGGDIYKQARRERAQWSNDFENQSTVRSINEVKKGTTDQAVPTEKIFDQIFLGKSGDQVRRVFDLLDKSGPDGQQLVRDIKGRFGEHILENTTKNVQLDTKGRPYVSTPEMNKLVTNLDKSGKLDLVFGPEWANHYRTLNEVTKEIQTKPREVLSTSGSGETILGALAGVGGEVLGQTLAEQPGLGVPMYVGQRILKAGMEKRKISRDQTKLKEFLNYKP
jgi:hypothetical protein